MEYDDDDELKPRTKLKNDHVLKPQHENLKKPADKI
jgi:hypothetical protein